MTDETRNSLIRREASSEHQGRELFLDRKPSREHALGIVAGPGARWVLIAMASEPGFHLRRHWLLVK
jgi:hypothetical protein